MPDAILTAKEAAQVAKVCTKTMYEWCHMDGFPVIRIGNCVRIPRDLFMDWLNAQATKGENS